MRSSQHALPPSVAQACQVSSSTHNYLWQHVYFIGIVFLNLSCRVVLGNINPQDYEGMTPLHLAAYHCRPKHVILLSEGIISYRQPSVKQSINFPLRLHPTSVSLLTMQLVLTSQWLMWTTRVLFTGRPPIKIPLACRHSLMLGLRCSTESEQEMPGISLVH